MNASSRVLPVSLEYSPDSSETRADMIDLSLKDSNALFGSGVTMGRPLFCGLRVGLD